MTKPIRLALLLMLPTFALAGMASAASIHDIVIDTITTCGLPSATCFVDPGSFGSPASGDADFTPIGLPWTYSFQTGAAVTWCDSCNGLEYDATFDSGSFTMTGPAALTFTGVVTSGTGAAGGTLAQAGVSFFGQWSDGLYGYGSAGIVETYPGVFEVSLDSNLVPEPSPFVLFAIGTIGFWTLARRRPACPPRALRPPRRGRERTARIKQVPPVTQR
jgi:hypothetical protein